MLTIQFDRLGLRPGERLLDVGAGFGRHAFEAARRGAAVTALDYAADETAATQATFTSMREAGELDGVEEPSIVQGDATALPFVDGAFDVVVTSEVLEHVPGDTEAIAEMVRVLRPGGRLAATVPAWLPELVNWKLADDYHAPAVPGGHVRIYTATELQAKLRAAGLVLDGRHRAHALHSPYWWLRCAVGPTNEDHWLVRRYRRLLEWEITEQPRSMRLAERVLAPVLGKSLVIYGHRPVAAQGDAP